MGLRLPKLNFPWFGLVGLGVEVTLPLPDGTPPGVRAVETMGVSVPLLGPGLVFGVVLVGLSLSGVVGGIRP